jgi:Na+-transporting NADH:ubiquinone oxidoreductase subunit A
MIDGQCVEIMPTWGAHPVRRPKTAHHLHMQFKLKKGLDIPIAGAPEQVMETAAEVTQVSLLGADYPGLKPVLAVEEGNRVALGQTLFTDKNQPEISYTSPASGVVSRIVRGYRRVLEGVEIHISGDDELRFDSYSPDELDGLGATRVRDLLQRSGLWTALRTRPYSRVPPADGVPQSIFVTAMDSNPLAADPRVVISAYRQDFLHGLQIIQQLTDGSIWICAASGGDIPVPNGDRFKTAVFEGPHPAGLPGTHIHYLHPVNLERSVWYLNYQDVIAIGRLFTSGRLWVERVVALAGPAVKRPRLIRTRLGASLGDLLQDELIDAEVRVLSGSILSGRRAADAAAFLGRYHLQVSVLREGREREFLGWLGPGLNKFSASNAFLSALFPKRKLPLTTSQHGSPRALIPVEAYQRVMPLRLLPTQLLRAILVGDTLTARELGCLELDEEDLALCSFVCPSKYDYGPALRETLNRIEKEG